MITNRWQKDQADLCKDLLDQRVYTSRLIGQEEELVLHGGGNTSVKDTATNLLGETLPVLYIKGSGWDLVSIERAGFPAVKLEPLLKLRGLKDLTDRQMVNELRTQLLDASAPNPSVECLLHAFLPHRFIDHTHANAILALTNQPDGRSLIQRLYGERVALVPYLMPGFPLAKLCAEIYEANPAVEGLILLHHGIFTFGDSAKESYDRMISLVRAAEEFARPYQKALSRTNSPAPELKRFWGNAIRGHLLRKGFRNIVSWDECPSSLEFATDPQSESLSQNGPLTPDHVIRTKRLPLYLEAKVVAEKDFVKFNESFERYTTAYQKYFQTLSSAKREMPVQLDPYPRVFILPGVGILSVGTSKQDANIASDIYRHTAQVISTAASVGEYQALPASDIFDVEYWVLEQDKLKKGAKRLPLTGRVAVVTGGASGIGLAITKTFLSQGASVFVLDRQPLEGVSPQKHGNFVESIIADVSIKRDVTAAFDKIIAHSGGIDILVLNAGIFPNSALLEEIENQDWEKSLRVNLDGALYVVSEGLKWLKAQKAGGDILFIASKNAIAPGPRAGSYSVAKAAQTQLARVCALEAGEHGIRVNTLHPHLILDTQLWKDGVVEKRAAAYGITPEAYRKNNLLKTALCSDDVAQAALALVSGFFNKTTGAQIPLDGGSDRTL